MTKSITLCTDTGVDVQVKLWEKNKRHYWAYDYAGCPKYGPFTSAQLALNDANTYSEGALV